jgi:hypothetical protein
MNQIWKPGDPISQAPNIQRVLGQPAQKLTSSQIMKLWRHRPKIFVKDMWDATLDAWQEEAYEKYMIGQRLGMIANKGPGKTWTLATLTWHFFITNHLPKMAVQTCGQN